MSAKGVNARKAEENGVAQPSEQDRFQVRTDTSGEIAPNISLSVLRRAGSGQIRAIECSAGMANNKAEAAC